MLSSSNVVVIQFFSVYVHLKKKYDMESEERYLQPMEIITFIVDSGEKTTNYELVNHFRPLLVHPVFGKENHELLKQITSQIVTVKKMHGSKCLELNPTLKGKSPRDILRILVKEEEEEQDDFTEDVLKEVQARSRTPIYNPSSLNNEMEYFLEPKLPETPPPLPPKPSHIPEPEPEPVQFPEQKVIVVKPKSILKQTMSNLSLNSLGTITEEHEEQEDESTEKESDEEQDEVFPLVECGSLKKEKNRHGRTSVKDLSRSFNQLIDIESQEKAKSDLRDQVVMRTRAHRHDNMDNKKRRVSADTDDGYRPLDDKARNWILAAARNDEIGVKRLINQDPSLAKIRDPSTGYTALHWASKHGNLALIHLLIGKYRANVNSRTRGGYTPLILAALHKRKHAYDLLLNPYGAEPDLRDYSGRKAEHYLPPPTVVEGSDGEAEYEDETDGKRHRARKRVDRSTTFLRELIRESKRPNRPRSQDVMDLS